MRPGSPRRTPGSAPVPGRGRRPGDDGTDAPGRLPDATASSRALAGRTDASAAPVRRRDRRGRGPRGPVLPTTLPAYRTRAERFDDLVLDAVEQLERTWARALDGTEFAVEDVPPSNPAPWERGGIPLGRYFPADAGLPARIVVYRRPLEARAEDRLDLADLVHDVVVEQVAHLLGRSPEDVDPGYGDAR